jgi:hypothetical protein
MHKPSVSLTVAHFIAFGAYAGCGGGAKGTENIIISSFWFRHSFWHSKDVVEVIVTPQAMAKLKNIPFRESKKVSQKLSLSFTNNPLSGLLKADFFTLFIILYTFDENE